MPQISTDDLAFAIEWLQSYDPDGDGPENGASAKRVAAWLEAEINRRTVKEIVQEAAKRNGVSTAHVRQAMRKAKAAKASLKPQKDPAHV